MTQSKTIGRRGYSTAAVASIVVFSAWVRWPGLFEGLWADECLTVYLARSRSLSELISRCRVADYSPTLFHLLLGAWGRAFGFGEVAVKALVFALGLAGIVTAALAAREMSGRAAAVVAAALVANNRLLIDMSSEVRPYALSSALAGLAMFALFRLRRRLRSGGNPRRAQMLLTASFIAFGYSHYAGMMAVAIVGGAALLTWLAGKDDASFSKKTLESSAAAGAAFLPWLPIFLYQQGVGLPWAPHFVASVRWERFLIKVGDFFPVISDGAAAGSWIGLAVLGVLATRREARRALRENGGAIVLCGLLSMAAFFAVAYVAPAARYLSVGVVFAALLVAVVSGSLVEGLAAPARRWALAGLGLVVAGSFIGRLWQYQQIRDYAAIGLGKSGIRTALRTNRPAPTDLLIALPDAQAQSVWYYAPPESPVRGFPRWNDPIVPDYANYVRDWTNPDAIPTAWLLLRQDVRRYGIRRVWVFNSLGGFALSTGCGRDFIDFLRSHLRTVKERSFSGSIEGTVLTVFEAPEPLE